MKRHFLSKNYRDMQIIEENDLVETNVASSVINTIDNEYEKNNPIKKIKILIFGVGGGGVNALDSMVGSDLENIENVEFVVANTDYQHLENSAVKNKILLGKQKNRGSGAGTNPEEGRTAAEESMPEIESYLKGYDMVFITAGMGGGTGTGAAPVIAKRAREMGLLVAAIVTTPFENEGKLRMEVAEKGVQEMNQNSDTLIIVPNQNLFRLEKGITFKDSLKMIDKVLISGVRGIVELIKKRGFMNLDFNDVRTVMKKIGRAMMGTGEASGENRAIRAVEEAISNPLLDNTSIRGAKGVIMNITGSIDMTLLEFDAATKRVKEEVNNDYANMIIGSVFDENLVDTIRVSIFATGIEDDNLERNEYNKNLAGGFSDNNYKVDNYDSYQDDTEEISKKSKEFLDIKQENKEENEYYYDENKYEEQINIKKQNSSFQVKKANPRRKFETYNDVYDNVDEETAFDMGESVKYNEFNRASRPNNQYTINSIPSKIGSIGNENYVAKQKPKQEKKNGFFSNLFGVGKKNENVKIVKVDDDEDDYDDLNISLYKTPTYLRNKEKKD